MCAFSYYTMFEVLCILEQQMVAANLYTVISCTRIGSSPEVGEGYLWVVPINACIFLHAIHSFAR